MEQARDSKEYSWKWLTAAELLSLRPCELTYVLLTSGVGASAITMYNGQDTSGEVIALIECLASRSTEFKPFAPIYCQRGLYAGTFTDNVYGVLIQWREIPQGIGYPK